MPKSPWLAGWTALRTILGVVVLLSGIALWYRSRRAGWGLVLVLIGLAGPLWADGWGALRALTHLPFGVTSALPRWVGLGYGVWLLGRELFGKVRSVVGGPPRGPGATAG